MHGWPQSNSPGLTSTIFGYPCCRRATSHPGHRACSTRLAIHSAGITRSAIVGPPLTCTSSSTVAYSPESAFQLSGHAAFNARALVSLSLSGSPANSIPASNIARLAIASQLLQRMSRYGSLHAPLRLRLFSSACPNRPRNTASLLGKTYLYARDIRPERPRLAVVRR